MSAALQLRGLTKSYGGTTVLDDVDLDVEEGSVFGFLGPNGAGKTTTLRIVTGMARASSGTVTLLGRDIARAGNSVRAQVGYLPDVPAFYEWMTAPEFMTFAGRLFDLEPAQLTQRTGMLLEAAGLAGVRTRIGGYSRGMKQRLGIAQALINAPRLLLLDEPSSALDPIGRKDVLDLIGTLGGRTTVFFSTHILGDVERVCDTVAILDRGKVLTQAPMAELKSRYGRHRITLVVTDHADSLATAIGERPWASAIERPGPGALDVTVTDTPAAQREIPALVAAAGAGLVRLEAGEMNLEEVFVELVGEAGK